MTNAQQWNPEQKRRTIPRSRVERWLGKDVADQKSAMMKDWYGPPINIRDLPGSVWIDKHGEYVGEFTRGEYFSADDAYQWALAKSKNMRRVLDTAFGRDAMPLYTSAGSPTPACPSFGRSGRSARPTPRCLRRPLIPRPRH